MAEENKDNNNEINDMENTQDEVTDQVNDPVEKETPETADNLSQTESWEAKYQELYDNYLRLFSEFDNFRKRSIKEKSDWVKTAGSDVILSMLPVLDDFERGLKSMHDAKDVESLKQGVELIFNKLRNTLTEKGLEEVKALGETFDPEFHEAITHIPAPTSADKGKVVDVIEKGYKMHDKIIRFPKVVIGQ